MAKNTKRKYAAIALGIVGIAGLSLASAAQLDVNENSPLVGVSTDAECDGAVDVNYDTAFTNGVFSITNVEVSDIHELCEGKDVTVYLLNETGAQVGTTLTDEIGGATVDFTIAAGTVNAASVYNAAVAIN